MHQQHVLVWYLHDVPMVVGGAVGLTRPARVSAVRPFAASPPSSSPMWWRLGTTWGGGWDGMGRFAPPVCLPKYIFVKRAKADARRHGAHSLEEGSPECIMCHERSGRYVLMYMITICMPPLCLFFFWRSRHKVGLFGSTEGGPAYVCAPRCCCLDSRARRPSRALCWEGEVCCSCSGRRREGRRLRLACSDLYIATE